MIDHNKLQTLVKQLYATVSELEKMFPGRHFTPDGHMVGSLGECLVADAYALELKPASNKGYDAITASGLEVEIKATQSAPTQWAISGLYHQAPQTQSITG
ncbi:MULTISPECIES: DUF6998 domain-containing protein [Marinobacter]|uniref:DUF6998 domain-containing protein n=1 Tax=Marinobacter TaxID=2742 RepID=UPI001CD94C4A|nr:MULTISPECIES: hypothetical protein [Marinobacter]